MMQRWTAARLRLPPPKRSIKQYTFNLKFHPKAIKVTAQITIFLPARALNQEIIIMK